jgi:hypothetical protein
MITALEDVDVFAGVGGDTAVNIGAGSGVGEENSVAVSLVAGVLFGLVAIGATSVEALPLSGSGGVGGDKWLVHPVTNIRLNPMAKN